MQFTYFGARIDIHITAVFMKEMLVQEEVVNTVSIINTSRSRRQLDLFSRGDM